MIIFVSNIGPTSPHLFDFLNGLRGPRIKLLRIKLNVSLFFQIVMNHKINNKLFVPIFRNVNLV